MAPNASLGGGGAPTAFAPPLPGAKVPPPSFLLSRESCPSLLASASRASSLSSSSSSSLAEEPLFRGGGASSRGGRGQGSSYQKQRRGKRVPRLDEPYLFDVPPDLDATYRPVPLFIKAAVLLASVLLVGRRDLSRLLSSPAPYRRLLDLLRAPLEGRLWERLPSPAALRSAMSFLFRTALLAAAAGAAVQESLFFPRRASAEELRGRGELPSALSRYEVVTPEGITHPDPGGAGDGERGGDPPRSALGVHYLKYERTVAADDEDDDNGRDGRRPRRPKFDGLSFHHGFGASSLSWLPVLPSLVDRIGSRGAVGVAHDAPGFGFTDYPDGDRDGGWLGFTSENNAGIGAALLERALDERGDADRDGGSAGEGASVAIFGHSMGARAAMLQALECASRPERGARPRLVVLVAPALEGVSLPNGRDYVGAASPSAGRRRFRRLRSAAHRIWNVWRKAFLDLPSRYALRRLVCGSASFWRKGLELAWGDPSGLSDSDVLRFRWPSVGKGWERGLVDFTRAKLRSSRSGAPDDATLLRRVTELEDVRVAIVFGSRDRVVRIEGGVEERIKKEFPSARVVRMEGLGHDPFEEDVDGFLLSLEEALEGYSSCK
ncbi:hypothetical protein ACHAWF_007518 [Thalassiosira exigua]